MAFSGALIVASYATAAQSNGPLPINGFLGKTMSATGNVFQIPQSASGPVLLRSHTSVQGFVATSQVSAADAATKASDANSVRWIIEADGQDHDIYVNPGDYIAWATA